MTHPALFTVQDALDALGAAIEGDQLSIIQHQVLRDLKDDLESVANFDTFSDVVEMARTEASKGY